MKGLLHPCQGPQEGSFNTSWAMTQHSPSALGPSFPLALLACEDSSERNVVWPVLLALQKGVEREGEGWFGLWLQAAPLTPETAGQPGPRARAILLWKAVAEMIWADDMAAMLCRALSLAA